MISIDLARKLIDFAGGTGTHARLSARRAEEQLEGAVAIHNTLERNRFAYLADEVGLGKTYVALGAFALFRHFNPEFRLLVIAPKKNIQEKWIKELRNFTRNNFRFPDLRVKALHDAPARSPVHCENLYEFARETSLDPDRDFFLRLTSFGFGLSAEESEGWRRRRDRIRELLPWIAEEAFDLHSKERFKENYARAVCCAIPEFDLVIVDEGHNLKGGLQKSAALRNRLLALTFGNDTDERSASERRRFPRYGPRAKRLLFLSATPLEDDYRHIWNQLDVFGFGGEVTLLADRNAADEEKRKVVSTFLIRRVSSVRTGGRDLTKNLYRREWRAGGVQQHDKPLPLPDDRQRLIVALVQKKVGELLAHERFNHSFQIGMLASFESFFRTAKVVNDDGENSGTFDDADQTENVVERQGIDVDQVNKLADSYHRRFKQFLPHPKMDSLVESLKTCFDSGRKALVFVRRVASVKEIEQKLEAEYDKWLFARLRTELRADLRRRLDQVISRYDTERTARGVRMSDSVVDREVTDDEIAPDTADDRGGIDTFFAWFFRGEGPEGILSAAAIANRFTQSRFALSSFFADNYAADLLGTPPGSVFDSLQRDTKWPADRLRQELESRAGHALKVDQKRRTHLDLFFAFQRAAVSIIAETSDSLRNKAEVILHQVFPPVTSDAAPVALGEWLETPTFFTFLRQRPELRKEIWPEDESKEYVAIFRRRELRRELVGSMFRRGHAFIDLYVTIANRLGRLETRGSDSEDLDNRELARELLDLLEREKADGAFRAYHELREAAVHFDLILDVNAPGLWESERRFEEVRADLGRLLRAQQPVGGMFGEVSKTLVAQFRMPGYPFVLVTTDLLQEGEDLHLFCSDIYHYGISWMPSSMEQRIGRIDRVRSQTERRLTRLPTSPHGDDLLQVYYPFLAETVEVFQVNRVLERVDRFIRLMHETLGTPNEDADRRLNLIQEIQHGPRRSETNREPLRSAFPVRPEMLRGNRRTLAVRPELHDDLLQHFWTLQDALAKRGVTWELKALKNARIGRIATGDRQQSFTVFLHSIEGLANVRCVSPIGQIDAEQETEAISKAARMLPVRIAAVYDPRFHQYNLTAEADALLTLGEDDEARLLWLIRSTAHAADQLEETLLHTDHELAQFRADLEQEPHFER